MNFYCDSAGSIIHVDPEKVYQGSANANAINFIGAFPANAQVIVTYRLPNGNYTAPQLMAYNKKLSTVQDEQGNAYNVWHAMLGSRFDGEKFVPDYTIAENYGSLKISFQVISANGAGNAMTLAVAETYINIIRTTERVEPKMSDGYLSFMQAVLAKLSQVSDTAVEKVEKTSSEGLKDTYEITYNGGTKSYFEVTNGEKGDKGDDGISVKHKWDGTTLIVESASGESSANLKGDNGKTPYIQGGNWYIDGNYLGQAKGDKGDEGKTPYIQDKYWYIDGIPTHVKAEGADGFTPYIQDDYWYINGVKKGKAKGDKGDTGKAFQIEKVYTSKSAMDSGANTDGLEEGSFVLIETGNVNDPDNSKLFVKAKNEDNKYEYKLVGDLSGSQGIQGKSAYQIWKEENNKPDAGLSDFLEDIKGESAYDIWLDQGNTGTEADFLESLIGNGVDAKKVYFSEDVTTGYAVGNIKLEKGKAILFKRNVSLFQNLKDIYEKVVYPTITQPSVSLTFSNAGAYEVGTLVSTAYSARFQSGSYEFGSVENPNSTSTGITVSSWKITDTNGNTQTIEGDEVDTTESGDFGYVNATEDKSYKVTAKANYEAGRTPIASDGSAYTAGKIGKGSKDKGSGEITAYRNTFYGTLETKSTITSAVVRGLAGKSGETLKDGSSFDVSIPVDALRVVIAYPSDLRDLTSIKDVNGLNSEILSSFKKLDNNVIVEGATSGFSKEYKVYILDYAKANDKENIYEVTI